MHSKLILHTQFIKTLGLFWLFKTLYLFFEKTGSKKNGRIFKNYCEVYIPLMLPEPEY